MSAESWKGFEAGDIAAFSKDKIAALGTHFGAKASKDLFAAVTDMTSLTQQVLSAANSAQIAALAPAKVKALSNSQIASLSADGVAGLNAADFNHATSALTSTQIGAISANAVSGLTKAALDAMITTQAAGLTGAQLAKFSGTQANAVINKLTAAQIASLPADTADDISTTNLSTISTTAVQGFTAAQIGQLTDLEVKALGSDSTKLQLGATGMTDAQLRSFTKVQVGYFGLEQLTQMGARVSLLA
jgi:hypothetical protein